VEHLFEPGELVGVEVVADDPSRTGSRDALAFIFADKLEALLFTGMMVEPESAPRHIGNIGEDIVAAYCYFAILQVLGVGIDHFVHQPEFFKKHGAADSIEVGAG
jgi:hypothetical protein